MKASKGVGPLSNSERTGNVDAQRRGVGVRLTSERGTTLTLVKVPKDAFSVNGHKGICVQRQRGGWLRSSHPLKSA